jgi:hypothetical protein
MDIENSITNNKCCNSSNKLNDTIYSYKNIDDESKSCNKEISVCSTGENNKSYEETHICSIDNDNEKSCTCSKDTNNKSNDT